MINIRFKENCNYNGKKYLKNEILEKNIIKEKDLPAIWKLNEKGFIYPLTVKNFLQFQKELKKIKEEVK